MMRTVLTSEKSNIEKLDVTSHIPTHNLPEKSFLKKPIKKILKNYCTIKSLML